MHLFMTIQHFVERANTTRVLDRLCVFGWYIDFVCVRRATSILNYVQQTMKKALFIGIYCCCMLKAVTVDATDHVQVDTEYGPVKGYVSGGVNVFNSIPFAKPPTGTRRFKPPEPPTPWDEPVDAGKLSYVCPQIKLVGSFYLVRVWSLELFFLHTKNWSGGGCRRFRRLLEVLAVPNVFLGEHMSTSLYSH